MSYTSYGNYNRTVRARTSQIDSNGFDGCPGGEGGNGGAGPRGPQGPTGNNGLPGIPGSQGTQGAQGAQGIPGSQGTQGPTGPDITGDYEFLYAGPDATEKARENTGAGGGIYYTNGSGLSYLSPPPIITPLGTGAVPSRSHMKFIGRDDALAGGLTGPNGFNGSNGIIMQMKGPTGEFLVPRSSNPVGSTGDGASNKNIFIRSQKVSAQNYYELQKDDKNFFDDGPYIIPSPYKNSTKQENPPEITNY